jgi:hypothetical protein
MGWGSGSLSWEEVLVNRVSSIAAAIELEQVSETLDEGFSMAYDFGKLALASRACKSTLRSIPFITTLVAKDPLAFQPSKVRHIWCVGVDSRGYVMEKDDAISVGY